MFNHLHQRILMDFFRNKSLRAYRLHNIAEAIQNYYGQKTN